MPQGGRPSRERSKCPNCGQKTLVTIYWNGGFGMAPEALEKHCNYCGYARDAQTGEIRNPGRFDLKDVTGD